MTTMPWRTSRYWMGCQRVNVDNEHIKSSRAMNPMEIGMITVCYDIVATADALGGMAVRTDTLLPR